MNLHNYLESGSGGLYHWGLKDTSRQRMRCWLSCVQMIDKQWHIHSESLPLCGLTRYWCWIKIIIWAVKIFTLHLEACTVICKWNCDCYKRILVLRQSTPQHCFPEGCSVHYKQHIYHLVTKQKHCKYSFTVYLSDLHDISNKYWKLKLKHAFSLYVRGAPSCSWRASVPQRSAPSSSKKIL